MNMNKSVQLRTGVNVSNGGGRCGVRGLARFAFTLIEMLVVIAIIAILAALIVPMAVSASAKQKINRAQTEMRTLEAAIDHYKSKRGQYPPDNEGNPATNQLFYELVGVVFTNTASPRTFERIHGPEKITDTTLKSVFSGPPQVEGIVNSAYVQNSGNKSEVQEADVQDFFPGIKPNQQFLTNDTFALLGVPIDGPIEFTSADGRKINPWRYVSSNPTNNTDTYDLWVDIIVRDKTNRICNWSDTPIILK